jgi:hypothetical protein
MSEYEFLNIVATPNEKHAGIATIRVNRSIVLRFKIVPKKDGSGYFPTCASYKVPDGTGSDKYVEAFMLDSRSENDDVISLVMSNFKKWQTNKSVFTKKEDVQDEEIPF